MTGGKDGYVTVETDDGRTVRMRRSAVRRRVGDSRERKGETETGADEDSEDTGAEKDEGNEKDTAGKRTKEGKDDN